MGEPTIGLLLRRGEITWDDLDEAVRFALKNAGVRHVAVGGRRVDVRAALEARPLSRRHLADHASTPDTRRVAVRNALLVATPEP